MPGHNSDRFALIITQGLNNTQRNQIQAVVKKEASIWWHEWPDVWIVASKVSATNWTKLIQVVFYNDDAQFLIFNLPSSAREIDVAGFTTDSTIEWLNEHYDKVTERRSETAKMVESNNSQEGATSEQNRRKDMG